MDVIESKPAHLFTLFALLCFCALLIQAINNWLFITDDVYYEAYGTQLSFERINEMIAIGKKWGWVNYAIGPILYAIKFLMLITCLYTGAFLFRVDTNINSFLRIILFLEILGYGAKNMKNSWTKLTRFDFIHFSRLMQLFYHFSNGVFPVFVRGKPQENTGKTP